MFAGPGGTCFPGMPVIFRLGTFCVGLCVLISTFCLVGMLALIDDLEWLGRGRGLVLRCLDVSTL